MSARQNAFIWSDGGDPSQAFGRDIGRHLVAAVELADRHVVPQRFQPRGDDARALVDRQYLIRDAVREEKARAAVRWRADDKSRREGDDPGKEVAVGEAERERVGGAVGEAADRDTRGIDRQAR